MRPPHSPGLGSAVDGSDRSGSATRAAQAGGTHSPTTFYDSRPIISKLTYGMTRRQVLRLDGRGTSVSVKGLSCLRYPINQHIPASGVYKAYTIDAVGVCFFSGKYALYHYKIDGKWDYNPNPVNLDG